MDRMFALAGVLTLLLSAVHSVLGEKLIFAPLREGGKWNEAALKLLALRRWWSVRAAWHLVSILGAGLSALLVANAMGSAEVGLTLGVTFLVAAVYWAVATRLGHPAWIVMGLIAALLLIPN